MVFSPRRLHKLPGNERWLVFCPIYRKKKNARASKAASVGGLFHSCAYRFKYVASSSPNTAEACGPICKYALPSAVSTSITKGVVVFGPLELRDVSGPACTIEIVFKDIGGLFHFAVSSSFCDGDRVFLEPRLR
jgi:hypothetical protein